MIIRYVRELLFADIKQLILSYVDTESNGSSFVKQEKEEKTSQNHKKKEKKKKEKTSL